MFYINELIKSCLWGIAGLTLVFVLTAIFNSPF